MFLSTTAEMPEDLKRLLSPSIYSDFLRCSLVSWLLNGQVDLKAIGIHHTPRTATEHLPEASLSNDTQRDLPSKRRRMRAKLRRRQREQQTPISPAERLDACGCREPSNQNRPKQVKLDDPDYIYVEDNCASPKRVDDHPKSSRCFRGDLRLLWPIRIIVSVGSLLVMVRRLQRKIRTIFRNRSVLVMFQRLQRMIRMVLRERSVLMMIHRLQRILRMILRKRSV